ncbi:MAG: hypothetical protein PHW79_11275 [Candidatus Marinimicrobia bacterium]|nr:hypothetical protein [Candidatus Neomarinimicrobiota bacterium]
MRLQKVTVIWLSALVFMTCAPRKSENGPTIRFSNLRTLVEKVQSGYIIVPRFNPDAQSIIFNGRLGGDYSDCIYLIAANGSAPEKLYESDDDLYFPAMSPDQKQIVFSKGLSRHLSVMNLDTKAVTALPVYGSSPTFLSDGETILYSNIIDGNLNLFNIPSGENREFTRSYLTGNSYPILMPDQSSAAWIENIRQGLFRINQSPIDSLFITQIFQFYAPVISMTCSPSGQLFLLTNPNGSVSGVRSGDTTVTDVVIGDEKTKDAIRNYAQFVHWSPQGNRVVYVGDQADKNSFRTPYLQTGMFTGSITIADVVIDGINSADIFQSPPAKGTYFFPVKKIGELPQRTFKPISRNNPPRIVSEPPEKTYDKDLFMYRVQAVEIDLYDNLRYSMISGPANAELLEKTGMLIWLPSDTGYFHFNVAVTDNRGGEDSQEFDIQVLPTPDWRQVSVISKKQPPISEFSAGMFFIDEDQDGILTPGENCQILIDLRNNLPEPEENVKLQLLISTTPNEIEWGDSLVYSHLEMNIWNRMSVPIRGSENLRDRQIVIRGILETKHGIRMLPANLIITGKNPHSGKK